MTEVTAPPAQGNPDRGLITALRGLLARFGIFLLPPALLLLGGAISPAFLGASNVSNLLLQIAPLGIVAIGQCFVMIVRGLDLSVASMMATAAVIATGFSGSNGDVASIVAAVLAMAVGVGVAIVAMKLTDTLHPPAGANPLLVVMTSAPWWFVGVPVAAGAVILVLIAVGYHRFATGKAYPAL